MYVSYLMLQSKHSKTLWLKAATTYLAHSSAGQQLKAAMAGWLFWVLLGFLMRMRLAALLLSVTVHMRLSSYTLAQSCSRGMTGSKSKREKQKHAKLLTGQPHNEHMLTLSRSGG